MTLHLWVLIARCTTTMRGEHGTDFGYKSGPRSEGR